MERFSHQVHEHIYHLAWFCFVLFGKNIYVSLSANLIIQCSVSNYSYYAIYLILRTYSFIDVITESLCPFTNFFLFPHLPYPRPLQPLFSLWFYEFNFLKYYYCICISGFYKFIVIFESCLFTLQNINVMIIKTVFLVELQI